MERRKRRAQKQDAAVELHQPPVLPPGTRRDKMCESRSVPGRNGRWSAHISEMMPIPSRKMSRSKQAVDSPLPAEAIAMSQSREKRERKRCGLTSQSRQAARRTRRKTGDRTAVPAVCFYRPLGRAVPHPQARGPARGNIARSLGRVCLRAHTRMARAEVCRKACGRDCTSRGARR